MSQSTTTTARRTKWHPTPAPPPSPKILNLPRSRRTRRKQPRTTTKHHHPSELHQKYYTYKGKFESPFDQENNSEPPIELPNSTPSSGGDRRERVEEKEVRGFEEEKWRFQAEILRAECNFLRMERELALKKLERNRVKMERTLRSAVQTLISGRNKIFEGKNVSEVLEEEIEDLAEKLTELTKTSRAKGHQFRKCSNFDTKACELQRRLEKLGGLSDDKSAVESRDAAESSWSSHGTAKDSSDLTQHVEVDKLRRNIDEVSKGMLDGDDEDFGSLVSTTANSSVTSSASTSKRIDQEPNILENKCSGRCKAIVRKIVEQVRAETEQWSQMQGMLRQVRGEMEQLQVSRDLWENRANNSEYENQSLKQAVEDWREKALSFEHKTNELKTEISALKEELQKSKTEEIITSVPSPEEKGNQRKESRRDESLIPNKSPQISLGKQLAKEKRMLLRRSKENYDKGSKEELDARRNAHLQPPLRDIGNMLPLARQYGNAIFPLQSPQSCRVKESFRK